jgi:hypothetical protein
MKTRLVTILLILSFSCVASETQAQAPPPASADATVGIDGKPLPGTSIPCAPIAEKRQELGCYVVARQNLVLPPGPLSWHLDTFASRAVAEAVKGPRGVVTEAFEHTWIVHDRPARLAAGRERRACGERRSPATRAAGAPVHGDVFGNHVPAGPYRLRS